MSSILLYMIIDSFNKHICSIKLSDDVAEWIVLLPLHAMIMVTNFHKKIKYFDWCSLHWGGGRVCKCKERVTLKGYILVKSHF